jgi:hypothetical protein
MQKPITFSPAPQCRGFGIEGWDFRKKLASFAFFINNLINFVFLAKTKLSATFFYKKQN